jgi:hypothetical protein
VLDRRIVMNPRTFWEEWSSSKSSSHSLRKPAVIPVTDSVDLLCRLSKRFY